MTVGVSDPLSLMLLMNKLSPLLCCVEKSPLSKITLLQSERRSETLMVRLVMQKAVVLLVFRSFADALRCMFFCVFWILFLPPITHTMYSHDLVGRRVRIPRRM